jgi:hypothetical protein
MVDWKVLKMVVKLVVKLVVWKASRRVGMMVDAMAVK